MKNRTLYGLLWVALATCVASCSEKEFSEDYDINFPVATITETSNETPFVGEEITLKGVHLNTATSIAIGAYTFPILSVNEAGDEAMVTVPRTVDAGALSVTNKYDRRYESEVVIRPQFFTATVTEWPDEIQLGRTFTLKGENMDLLKEVKVGGVAVASSGAATPEMATYSSRGANLSIGDEVMIEVIPKNGEMQASPIIRIVAPSDTYKSMSTLNIVDINEAYQVENGDAAPTCIMEVVPGLFGNAFRVSAATGNGWNGIYAKIYSDNDGKGFDLSAYTNPCITMLINTYGKRGYMQPLTYDSSNGEQDRHLDGKFGYNDDYASQTDGWEWRSYPLEQLDFPIVKGKIEKIGVQFRGGNVGNGNDEAFDIAVNRVMITDGPLHVTVAWDAEQQPESYEAGSFQLLGRGSNSALTGVTQGAYYANYTGPNATDWSKKVIAVTTCKALDATKYQNGVWINFLVNTGTKGGYIQPCMGDGWMNLMQNQGYGDDYQLTPTNNEWQWRSIQVTPGEGDLSGWDAYSDFVFKIQILGGNYGGADMDISCDYFVFTTVPLDPKLKTEEL
ncbi:MAG: hypothetical protein ACRCUJ_13115 [Phocaeicola sp.]